jgi:hypothetical protein
LVRPLGAFERRYHRRQQKSTMHFCMVAEIADHFDPFTCGLVQIPATPTGE